MWCTAVTLAGATTFDDDDGVTTAGGGGAATSATCIECQLPHLNQYFAFCCVFIRLLSQNIIILPT